jgi:hypothetical protein
LGEGFRGKMKGTLRANKQQAFIQDAIRAAFREPAGEGPTLHPFVLAVQSLRREIEFMEPFTTDEMKHLFEQAEPCYDSAKGVLAEAEAEVLGDSEVSGDADRLLPLVEYHLNLLKIHRLLFTRQVEGYGLIPAAAPGLQKQVVRTYEALGGLSDVLTVICQVPKSSQTPSRKPRKAKSRGIRSAPVFVEEDEALSLDYRVSPFVTEGSRKGTVSIDGSIWPRFV